MLRRHILGVLGAALLSAVTVSAAAAWDIRQTSEYCQILDDPYVPLYEANFSYIPRSGFGNYGKSDTLEFELDWKLAYFRDVVQSDLELDVNWRSLLFPSTTSLQLPDQLMSLTLDPTMTWRYDIGQALQVGARPGIYSDAEEFSAAMLAVPFSCVFIHAFDRRLSASVGLELRPGFERVVMPLVMVKCEVDDFWLVEAGLPHTRVSYCIDTEWTAYGGLDWESTTYTLRDKGDYDRDKATVEDFRLYGGLANQVTDQCRAAVEFGLLLDRSIEFKRGVEDLDSKVGIDNMIFVRFALSGPF